MKVGISYKHDAMMLGAGILDMERGHFSEAKPFYWQADLHLWHSIHGVILSRNRFKKSSDILQDLVDIVKQEWLSFVKCRTKS